MHDRVADNLVRSNKSNNPKLFFTAFHRDCKYLFAYPLKTRILKDSIGISQMSKKESELDTLDSGTIEFLKWLIAKDTNSGDTLIVIKDYLDNKYVILFDKSILKDVIVDYRESMPLCITCNTDDCGHVGFAICLKQNYDRDDHFII